MQGRLVTQCAPVEVWGDTRGPRDFQHHRLHTRAESSPARPWGEFTGSYRNVSGESARIGDGVRGPLIGCRSGNVTRCVPGPLCCLFEIAQLVVALPVTVLRNVLYESNPAGIEANPAFFGFALIMFTIFNFLLLTMHNKTAHNTGVPFLAAGVTVLPYIGVAEVLIHAVSFLRTHLDMVGDYVGRQLIVLAIGAWVFNVGKVFTYRIVAARFEKVDL